MQFSAENSSAPNGQASSYAPYKLADRLSAMDISEVQSVEDILSLHEQFVRYGYVNLPGFLRGPALETFREEMRELEKIAMRRGFEMPGYETPRRLSVVGGSIIRQRSPEIYALYHHHAIRGSVERIVGRRIYSCRHPEEFMVANFLQTAGDTHGWHLDDPPIALVIFAEAPSREGGGEAEMVVNWVDLCERKKRSADSDIADLVEWSTENMLVERRCHKVGDAYLLRADRNLHRVVPLTRKGEHRWVVNLAFQTEPESGYGETASLLYSPASQTNALPLSTEASVRTAPGR